MGFITDYQYREPSTVMDCSDGVHAIKIKSVSLKTTKQTNKQFIEIVYAVKDSNNQPYVDRIVEGDYFDVNLSRFFDAFEIGVGDWAFANWVDKIGSAYFEHKKDTYTDKNGNTHETNKAEIKYYIKLENKKTPPVQPNQPQQPNPAVPTFDALKPQDNKYGDFNF